MEEAVHETLFMIKPDAVKNRKVGPILAEIEKAGFEILDLRLVRLTPDTARRFYAVHEGKPFLNDLVAFMSSGPAVPGSLASGGAVVGSITGAVSFSAFSVFSGLGGLGAGFLAVSNVPLANSITWPW